MRTYLRIPAAALLILAFVATTRVVAAETKAVQTVARIMLSLNHFASDPDKKALKDIIDDKTTTAQERTVAQALVNVLHTVNAADKPKLQAIVDDKTAPESVKTLAGALLRVNHTVADADKDALKKLAA